MIRTNWNVDIKLLSYLLSRCLLFFLCQEKIFLSSQLAPVLDQCYLSILHAVNVNRSDWPARVRGQNETSFTDREQVDLFRAFQFRRFQRHVSDLKSCRITIYRQRRAATWQDWWTYIRKRGILTDLSSGPISRWELSRCSEHNQDKSCYDTYRISHCPETLHIPLGSVTPIQLNFRKVGETPTLIECFCW